MIEDETSEIVTELKDAANHLDLARAEAANDRLISVIREHGAQVPELLALKAFGILRKKRWFEPMTASLETYLQCATPSPLARTLYAQALIDQDQLMAGLALSRDALQASDKKSKPAEEARGLIGRAHKQAFVDAGDAQSPHARNSLQLSAQAYSTAYENAVEDPAWPAVNLLALSVRAQADGLELGVQVNEKELGEAVLAHVQARLAKETADAAIAGRDEQEMPWLLASAFEACLALKEDQKAMTWFKRYLACSSADAFEFGSTARQLREIWRLERHANQEIALVLPMLEAELIRKSGGKLDNPLRLPKTVDDRVLQGIFGDERFHHRQWLQQGLDASDAIVRVEDVNGNPKGTGFVVRGRRLRNEWGDLPLVMTNAHVIGDSAPPRGVARADAMVRFTTRTGPDAYPGVKVDEIKWRNETLDVAVLSLCRRPDPDIALEIGGPENLSIAPPPSRICAVGHPDGRDISYSIYDNELRELAAPELQYTSPTMYGSSGSALFDGKWRAVGIHRGEILSRKVNFGTLLNAVCAAIAV